MTSAVLDRPETLAERLVRRQLSRLAHGELTVGGDTFGRGGGLKATVRVRDARFYAEVAYGGSVGAGEAYMLGYWDADDLTAVLRILAANREAMDGLEAASPSCPRRCAGCCTGRRATRATARAATSPRTTTWATIFSRSSSTRR